MANLVSISSDVLPASAHVVAFVGKEALSVPYRFEIGLEINDADFDMDQAIRGRASVTIHTSNENQPYVFHGIIAAFELLQEWRGKTLYRAVLVPQLWDLSQTLHSRIFTDATIVEIISAVLENSGLTSDDYAFDVTTDFPPIEHVCQYKESNLAFITRWIEREGMYYYFQHGADREKLIITDHLGGHDELDSTPVRYVPSSSEDSMALDALEQFICRRAALPASIAFKDYDYLNPTLDVSGTAPVAEDGHGEIRLYGKGFATPAEGKRLAQIRAEALLAQQKLYLGRGRVFYLRTGYKFSVDEHPRAALNRSYLAIAVEHFANQSATAPTIKRLLGLDRMDDLGVDEYGIAVTAIADDVQYRSPEQTPWPRIDGYEHATVCGEAESQYAQIDEHGRYNVRVLFDESDLVDGSASTWIRMLQPHGGGNEGFHFPLRKQTEVLLMFLGGDPDRPVIAGTVPNAHTPSPVTNANHTYNVIQTGGLNRLEMRDNEGTQHIRMSSPPENTFIQIGRLNEAYNIHVETDGRALWRCGGDWHRIIDGERLERVHDDASLVVTDGNHDIDIQTGLRNDHVTGSVDEQYDDYHWLQVGDFDWLDVGGDKWDEIQGAVREDYHTTHDLTVDGAQTITVDGDAAHNYNQKRELTVGGDCIVKVEAGKWDLTCKEKGETITGDWSWDCLGGHVKLTVDVTSETLIGLKNENLIGGKIESLVGLKIEGMLALHLSVRAGAHLEMDGSVNLGETPCWLTTAGAKIEGGATWISEKIMNIIL